MFLPQCLRYFNILSIRIASDILFFHLYVSVHVCAHMHINMQLHMTCMQVCRGQRILGVLLDHDPMTHIISLIHGLSQSLEPAGVFFGWGGELKLQQSSGLSQPFSSTTDCSTFGCAQLFCGYWGSKLGPSYFHSKYLTNQTISSALEMTLMKKVKTEVSKRGNGESLRKSRIEVQ